MAVCGDQCVPNIKSKKPTWEKNLIVSKIKDNIIPIVVKTAIVEKRKKINLKIYLKQNGNEKGKGEFRRY